MVSYVSYVSNMCKLQDQIVKTLDHPAENVMEAEQIERDLEACERAYVYAGKHQHARRA